MKIMVAFDGSKASKVALEFISFFKKSIDTVYVVYVIPYIEKKPPKFDEYTLPEENREIEKMEKTGEKILDEARNIIRSVQVNAEFELVDDPDRGIEENLILTAIKHGVDTILMGQRKLGKLGKVFFDSVSSGLLRESRIPVLVIPPKLTEEGLSEIEHDRLC